MEIGRYGDERYTWLDFTQTLHVLVVENNVWQPELLCWDADHTQVVVILGVPLDPFIQPLLQWKE